MFNKVGDFLQPKNKQKRNKSRTQRECSKAYKLAQKMRRDLEKDPALAEKLRQGATTIKEQ